jgi:hypothetical protein
MMQKEKKKSHGTLTIEVQNKIKKFVQFFVTTGTSTNDVANQLQINQASAY